MSMTQRRRRNSSTCRIDDYLLSEYAEAGRGDGWRFDCFGLVRHARHALYGRALLPEFGAVGHSAALQAARLYSSQAGHMRQIEKPVPGAIAAVLGPSGAACLHVALIIGRTGRPGLDVLEITATAGARRLALADWLAENEGKTIRYHDDQNLSEQA